MPKAKRNASLSRVARRRVAASENLPSPATRKKEDAGAGTTVSIESRPLGEEKIATNGNADADAAQTENQNKSKTTTTKTTTATRADDKDEPDVPQRQQLSRGQRKRQAKREQFLKKEKMILSSLMLQRQEDQKKRIDGLDAIKQALMDTATKNASGPGIEPRVQHVTTNKAKRQLVAKEVEHMNLILQHPSFKQDPFETMQQHLKNTFAEERKQQELLSKKRTEQERLKSEAKKSIKKKSQKKKYKPRRTR